MQSLLVRTFKEGDEDSIVKLFNTVHQDYGGFVPRTTEYWKWCCLERPDVDEKGTFLVCTEDEVLLGYLVAGSSGNIWEFCVSEDNQYVSELLLAEATKYLDMLGASEITVNVPPTPGVRSALCAKGFDEAAGTGLFATTLNPTALLQALIGPQETLLTKEFKDTFTVNLHDTPYGVNGTFSLKIENDSATVSPTPQQKNSIVIETEFMNFLSILLGESNPTQMLLTGKIKVKPFWKFHAVLKILQMLRLRDPWFFPLSDMI
jgi:predicted acetyltransferase